MTTYLHPRFFWSRTQVDPDLFSRLQLFIAAHPDVETSCVLASLLKALYAGSELFFMESLQRLDSESRNVARELMAAKASNAFTQEAWDNALAAIAVLPVERGGFGKTCDEVPFALGATDKAVPAFRGEKRSRAGALQFGSHLRGRAMSVYALLRPRGGFGQTLWGAPAAVGVLTAAFGIVMLEEHLGFRRIVLDSPPAQWFVELVQGTGTFAPLADAIHEEEKSAAVRSPAAESELRPVSIKVQNPATATPVLPVQDLASIAAKDAAVIRSTSGEIVRSKGAADRIAPASFSRDHELAELPREGSRPDAQTRPKPVGAQLPSKRTPLLVSPPPPIEAPAEKVKFGPPAPPPIVKSAVVVPPRIGATVETRTPAVIKKRSRDEAATQGSVVPGFIHALQSGGREEQTDAAPADDRGRGGASADFIEQLDPSAPGNPIERVVHSASGGDTQGRHGDRIEGMAYPKANGHIERRERGDDNRIEQIAYSSVGDLSKHRGGLDHRSRAEWAERAERLRPGDRLEGLDRPGPRDGRAERHDRVERSGPRDRLERPDRSARGDRHERADRIDRSARGRGG